QRDVFRHFDQGREQKEHVNRGDDQKIDKTCGDSGHDQSALVIRKGKRGRVFRLIEIQLRLKLVVARQGNDCSLRLPFAVWHTQAVVQFAIGIFLLLGTQQDQIQINADGNQGWTGHIYHAENKVVVTYREMRLEADEVDYNDETNIVTAGKHIVYSNPQEH